MLKIKEVAHLKTVTHVTIEMQRNAATNIMRMFEGKPQLRVFKISINKNNNNSIKTTGDYYSLLHELPIRSPAVSLEGNHRCLSKNYFKKMLDEHEAKNG